MEASFECVQLCVPNLEPTETTETTTRKTVTIGKINFNYEQLVGEVQAVDLHQVHQSFQILILIRWYE